MTLAYTPYVIPLIIAAVISGWNGAYLWRRRKSPGGETLAILAWAICLWQVGYALELAGIDLPTKLIWAKVQYLGIVSIPQLLLVFALQYTQRTRFINLRGHLVFSLIPAITVLLVFTNEHHNLIWTTVELSKAGALEPLVLTHGRWFWVHWTYSYVMLASATLIIIRQLLRGQTLYRLQSGAMLTAVLAPWVGNIIYITGLSPVPNLDLTPFAFTLTVILTTWAVFGFRLIDLSPIARDLVIDDLPDSMIVIDPRNTIVDVNQSATRLLGQSAAELIGKPAELAMSRWPDLFERYRDALNGGDEFGVSVADALRWYDLQISPLYDARHEFLGRVITLRDISERKQAEERLRQLSLAVGASPVSIIITDRSGTILYANPKFSQISGYSLDEVVGKNPRILKTEFTSPLVHRQLWATIIAGREWHGEFCNRKKNGELYWERASISPIMDENGQPTSYVAVKEDITEQRRMTEQLRQQNAYLSFMHQITLELLDRREIDDLLQGIVDGAAALLDAPYATLVLKEGDALRMRAYTGNQPYLDGAVIERDVPSFAWDAHDTGLPVVENDYQNSSKRLVIHTPANLHGVANFPVMAGKRCVGVLGLARSKSDRPFSQDEIQSGMLFTRLAALTLDNAGLYDAAVKEIAEHKRTQAMLQQSEARYRQIVEGASDLIFQLDAHQQFTYVNPTTLRVLGAERVGQLLGHPLDEIVAAEWREQVSEHYLQQIRRRETTGYYEFPVERQDGEQAWLGVSVQLIEDRSEIEGFQCLGRDITAAHKAREMLILARDQAVEASHFKSQLVARVSHELRTPLGAIMGFIELLQSGIYGELNDEQARTAQKIKVSSDYLTSMINDLLDGAQLEARRMTLRLDHCSPARILEHMEARMMVLAANKGLSLVTSVAADMPRKIIGDMQRLEQILTNLVGNAIKYTEHGSVCVLIFPSGHDRWGMSVSDTGMGIPEHDLPHIFEPFYQVEREDGQTRRGTGLGLSITRQLVDLMGGKINVESKPGQGSVFTVILPMEKVVSNTAALE